VTNLKVTRLTETVFIPARICAAFRSAELSVSNENPGSSSSSSRDVTDVGGGTAELVAVILEIAENLEFEVTRLLAVLLGALEGTLCLVLPTF
jgi:hypothetical protein